MTDHAATLPTAGAPGAGSGPVLEVTDLRVSFPSEAGTVEAVRGLTFEVAPGEVLGIVGESGSGKSVSALAAMGLLPDRARISGSVRFGGRELLGLSDKEMSRIRGAGMAMVFQDPLSALTPVYTIGWQIGEAIRAHHPDVSKAEAHTRAVDLLDLVGIPNPAQRAKAFPHEFSGGMRQRAMIAMAVANDPAVILADEPTTALDVTIQAQILDVLGKAQEATGAAIVMITHDLGVVAGFADRVMVMYAGRAVETGGVEDLFYGSRMPYTLGLIGALPRPDTDRRVPLTPVDGTPPSLVDLPVGCPFAPRCPLVVDACLESEPDLVAAGAEGHRAACHRVQFLTDNDLAPIDVFPAPAVDPAAGDTPGDRAGRPVVLEVEGLVRSYPVTKGSVFRRVVGSVRAVDGISFDVRAGETLGLVGESGCGKTTTINEVLALGSPTEGTISVFTRPTGSLNARQRAETRAQMGIVFQDPNASLDPRLPVGDILAEGLKTHGVPAAQRRARVNELLTLVGLGPEHINRYPAEFSGGQRQRIGIARALALEPRLVVLDEPVSALDVSIRAGVVNLLEELRARLDLSYVFVAHDLSVVRHIADRVAVMYLGRIVEQGSVSAVFDRPVHPYTQALLSAVPVPDPRRERARTRVLLHGDLPSPSDVPTGCRFRGRCPLFPTLTADQQARCVDDDPRPTVQGDDHEAACHWPQARSVF